MKGLFGDRLSDAQYEYLQSTISTWYNTKTVVFCNTSYSTVGIDVYDASTGYWNLTNCNRNGDLTTSSTNDPNNYRATVWMGDPGSANYLYLFGDNGYVNVSSYTTLGIGLIPASRVVLDTEDLVAIKDSDWSWVNLNNVLGYLKGLGVKVFTNTSYTDITNIAYQWDSDMAYRIFSPYMAGWLKGAIDELNIANYLKLTYGSKWDKMYDALTAEYNPLDNYNMHEVEHTDDVKDEDTTNNGTSSNEGTTANTTSTSDTGSNDVFAFNSETASHDTANANSGSSTDNGSTTQSGTTSNTGTYTTDNDLDRELSREGNIGVTTSQQMIEQELNVRRNIVLNTVRDDIIYTMTIPYYGGKY